MVVAEQCIVLKTVKENKEQARVDHRQVQVLPFSHSLTHEQRTGHSLTCGIAGDFVAQ